MTSETRFNAKSPDHAAARLFALGIRFARADRTVEIDGQTFPRWKCLHLAATLYPIDKAALLRGLANMAMNGTAVPNDATPEQDEDC